jgi:hypothetical protein
MTIATNQVIVYQDLLDFVLTNLKAKCSNIDTFASNVPVSLRNGSSYVLASTPGGKGTVTATGTVNDSLLVTVPTATVEQQLNDFLIARGIKNKPDRVVAFKDIMNFYNNIASFLATKLMFVSNSFGSGTFIFYNSANNSYPSVNLNVSDINFTNPEIKTSITDLMNAINNVSNTHYAATTIVYTCSSSSSSSCSSSSSSSSCSSSSSMFIAYMDI